MNPKVQKGALITIVVLLVIFLPLAGVSLFFKITGSPSSKEVENTNKEFYFDNKLWFYDESGNLLNTYECTTSYCGYAINTVTDNTFGLEDFTVLDNTPIGVLNNRYAILDDSENEEAFVYDFVNGISYKMAAYAHAKDYGIGISDNRLIIENTENKYGVIRLGETIEVVIPMEYDFIGVKDERTTDNKILADYYITLQNGNWNIMDKGGATLTDHIYEPIIDYTGTYIITKNANNRYHLVNYDGEVLLTGDYLNLSFTDRYVNVTTLDNEFYVYDVSTDTIVSDTYQIDADDDVLVTVDINNNVVISINNTVVETITRS